MTEWQLIPDLGYVYLNLDAPQPTWAYDEALKTWVYMEGAGRPYGSLYMAEWTPDGYYVNADGVWGTGQIIIHKPGKPPNIFNNRQL